MSEENSDIAALRAKAKQADEAEARARAAERKLAFAEAGVSTAGPVGEAFLDRYEGELTPDAIRAEATKWNLYDTTPEPEPEPEPAASGDQTPSPDQQTSSGYDSNSPEVQQQLQQAQAQGQPAPTETPKLGGVDAALAAMEENQKNGMSRRDVVNQAFTDVIAQAGRGDSQARFDRAEWQRTRETYGNDDSA